MTAYVGASPGTSTCEVPRDVNVFKKVVADFVCDNGVVEVHLLMVKLRFRLGRVTAKL